uniref:N-alpha-acetyltransferase 25, NatB auxiliary subunit n=1 Tax=Salmo trutta TaxID=8032 RepID=A0A673YNT7_SALTR
MAIQQADKLLKKHKDLHCAKVLKAIGLQRTGKQDEAFSLAQEVATLEPTDDNSLQALTILYREMHRPELVTKLYEAAVKKVPLSEEYHSHLFMAYARVGEYKKMQQAGMALYKTVPKNPYYFWSVMSLVMQAISAQDEKLAQTMFLPLAERMVEKMVKEEKIEAEAEVQLYFMILERLGKCVEALDVVRGPLGEKLTSELRSRENKCMMMYQRLQLWPECNALSYKLLLKNPDDWQFYLSYFDSLFHLMDKSWSPPNEGKHCVEGPVQTTVAEAVKFVVDRMEEEDKKESRPLRGPYMACLELIHRLRQRGCPDEQELGDPLELMLQFFGKFGDKPCCITDLKIYLHLLPPEQHTQFKNRLGELVPLGEVGEDGFGFPGDTKALQRHLCVCQLSRVLGLQHALDTEGKLCLITELKAHYHYGLQFGKSCLKTELQFSDTYCLMVAHVYIDLWTETGDENMLWQCLGVLEEGLSFSPSNAQFKLLLLLLFCRLGAFQPVVDLYSSLDAKHVQHDTIGYLLTRYAGSLGQFAAASQSYNFSLRFFHSNQKDTSEYIIQAYKYGAFEKIPEFIAFRTRLNQSLHFAQVRTERMLLDLYTEADITSSLEESVKAMGLCPEEDDIPWDNMRDNRDLTVLFSWDPKDRELTEEHRRLSLQEELVWLKVRSLTLRLLASLALLGHAPSSRNSDKANENGVSAKSSTLQTLLSQLDLTLQTAAQITEKQTQVHTRFTNNCVICHCQASALRLSLTLQELETTGLVITGVIVPSYSPMLICSLPPELLSRCKGEVLEMKDSRLMTQPSLLETLVFFVETVCVVLWVASYSASVLRPLKSSLQKKRKKKKDSSTAMVHTHYRLILPLSHGSFSSYSPPFLTSLSVSLSVPLPSFSQEECGFTRAAMDKVQNSYLGSLQELGDLLRKRADSLKSLKF